MARDAQLWIMVDIETSGPHIGTHSMTELGAVVGSLKEGVAAAEAMKRFAAWSAPYLKKKALFVARPAAFDWPWIVWYAWTYLGENPFGFKSVCASSWFQAKGKRFEVDLPHVAVQDAEIQLHHFVRES